MQQSRLRPVIRKTIALAWGMVCIIVFMLYPARYSLVQGSGLGNFQSFALKAAEIQATSYVINLLTSFIEIILFCLIYIMAGILPVLYIASKHKSESNNSITTIIVLGSSFLVGYGIFSTVFFLLAYFYSFTAFNILWITILVSLPGLIPTANLLRGSFIKTRSEPNNKSSGINTDHFYWMSIVLLFTSLLLSTSRFSYDAVALYFSNAKITALTNHLMFFQGDSLLVSEMQVGIQFSALIQIFSEQTARLLPWLSGCVILVFSIAIAEKIGLPAKTKGIIFALVLTSTAFTDLLGDGKVDLTSSALALAAVYWLVDNDDKNKNLLAGFFAGLAMASRIYNVFLLTIFIGALYLLRIYFKRKDGEFYGLGPFVLSLTWVVIGAALPLTFHLFENWLVYHDAFAMLNYANALSTNKWQWSFDPQSIWLLRLTYPFIVTFLNTSQSLGNISPLLLGFLPNVFFSAVRKRIRFPRLLIEVTGAALVTLVLWTTLFFTILEIRYIFFLWFIFFIAISEVIVVTLEDKSFIFNRTLSTLTILLLVFSALRVVYISIDSYSPLDKQGNPQCSRFYFCDYLKSINESAPQGSRTLTLSAFRYYLRPDLFACSTKGDEYVALHDASMIGADAFWEEVYRQGYEYIAYENNYTVRHLRYEILPDPSNTPDWMKIKPIYGTPGDETVAYQIMITSAPPVTTEKICIQNNGIWKIQRIP